MQIYRDIFYTDEQLQMQSLDLYLPEKDHFPVVIYFHYGGFVNGDKTDYQFIPQLVEKGIAVISANYRLYPDAHYPDFLEDGAAVVAWAYKNMPKYGKVTQYYIAGSSAGGYLTAMLCFDKRYLAKHNIDSDSVSGYVLDGAQPTTHFNVLVERCMDKRRVVIDEAAPIYYITDERKYPPMLIVVAEHDLKNRVEQNMLLLSTMKHFGHNMDRVTFKTMTGYKHVGYVNAFDEYGNSIFANLINSFVQTVEK